MIKMKVLDNRFRVYKQMKALEEKLEELPKAYLKEMANVIVTESPVDTGTYMDAHNIGEQGAVVSSRGKPRNQPWQTHAEAAIERLYAQIDALPSDTKRYYLSNNSEHAFKVEYDLGYLPYTIAKGKGDTLLELAKQKVGL